jgi:hypothetical protein
MAGKSRSSIAQQLLILSSVAWGANLGCSYDFEQFAAKSDPPGEGGTSASGGATPFEGGGTSTGGVGANNGGTVNNGGTANSGGTTSFTATSSGSGGTSTGGRSSGTSEPACAGVRSAGICWYLGVSGASCDETCTVHGGTAPGTASFVGTPFQGGSLNECATILLALGESIAPMEGVRYDGLGVGCHIYDGVPWWLSSPNFNSSAWQVNTRLVCGCIE